MTPDEYRTALGELAIAYPVEFQWLIQKFGPMPDGKTDEERATRVELLREKLPVLRSML